MAEVVGSGTVGFDKYWHHVWSGLANGDTGRPVQKSGLERKTVQVTGTFGASGSVTIQGSMDGSTWFTMTDVSGTAATFSAAGGVALAENPRYIRPEVTAGDGTTSLTVAIGASANE